jgi:hypothetical protein
MRKATIPRGRRIGKQTVIRNVPGQGLQYLSRTFEYELQYFRPVFDKIRSGEFCVSDPARIAN